MDNSAISCTQCSHLKECGGLSGNQLGLLGCFMQCASCPAEECDFTCPSNPNYLTRWAEVGGLFKKTHGPISSVPPAVLPIYIPRICHGKRRHRALNCAVVALSLYDVIKGRAKKRYGRVTPGAEFLRREFGLTQDAQILLISVGFDQFLERFWREHRAWNIPDVLNELNLLGVTAPNFSFFNDAPRTHSLWNRRRMLAIGERISAAGGRVILHLNASNAGDWDYWASFLREHPEIVCVAKEFQTGLSVKESAADAMRSLITLQQHLGRPLHPVLIGGGRFAPTLRKRFPSFTIVDSVPFMRTVKRKIFQDPAVNRVKWRHCKTEPNACLSALMDYNVSGYKRWVVRQTEADR